MSSPSPNQSPAFPGIRALLTESQRIVIIAALHALVLGPFSHQANLYLPGLVSAIISNPVAPLFLLFQLPETTSLCKRVLTWTTTDEASVQLLGYIWSDVQTLVQYSIVRILIRFTTLSILKTALKWEAYVLVFSVGLVVLWAFLDGSNQSLVLVPVVLAMMIPGLPIAVVLIAPFRIIWVSTVLQIQVSIAFRRIWQPFILSGGSIDAARFPQYSYTPLPTARSIRLLRIHSRRSRTLHCTLETHELSSSTLPVYDGLSYCWGDSTPTHSIILHDPTNQRTRHHLRIPTNAFKVLADRASILEPRLIWLDYLCIDQRNIPEKGMQIPLMREIYSHARRTVAWIGDAHTAKRAQSLIKTLNVKNQTQPIQAHSDAVEGMVAAAGRGKPRPSREAEALRDMLLQPYFFRVWMVQEIATAHHVDVRYGNAWVDWDMLAAVCGVLGDPARGNLPEASVVLDEGQGRGFSQVGTIDRLRDEAQEGREASLVHLLSEAGKFRASKAEDHVFSLVGISREKGDKRFLASFGKGPAEVFARTTVLLLEQDERLSALHMAGVGHDRQIPGLPSWVPDYSCLPKTSSFQKLTDRRFYTASATTSPSISIDVASNTLIIQALAVDSIATTSKSFLRAIQDGQVPPEEHLAFRREVDLLTLRCPEQYPTGTGIQSRDEAAWRTWIGNCIHPMTIQSEFVYPAPISFGEGYNAAKRVFELQERNADPSTAEQLSPEAGAAVLEDLKLAMDFLAVCVSSCFGRRFAVTSDGRMAMVPPGAMQDDLVLVVLGAETPFLVRKIEHGTWKLIGECYVHGLMEGEALGHYDTADFALV